MTNSRKPRGYLKDFSNLESELNQIIEELDHFPTKKELINMGKISIYNAYRHHGGSNAVRERMG